MPGFSVTLTVFEPLEKTGVAEMPTLRLCAIPELFTYLNVYVPALSVFGMPLKANGLLFGVVTVMVVAFWARAGAAVSASAAAVAAPTATARVRIDICRPFALMRYFAQR